MNKHYLRLIILYGLFAIPFIPFLVSSSLFFPFITTKAFAWRIIVEIIFAGWILLALQDADYRPKKSLILYSLFIFLGIIGLADLFGVAPIKSFWSNFERMEGFITLLHLGMFFIVISSVFKEIDWKRWWNVSLLASFLMVLYSVLQLIGLKTINQGGVRVDGTLGNAIYLAVYMLFHIFIAFLFMWREWKNVALRWVYGLLILAQASILYYTATRGAILGLLGGVIIMAVLNIRNKEYRLVRKVSIGFLVGLVILVGGFVTVNKNVEFIKNSPVFSRYYYKSTEFIKNSPVLSRFSSINKADIKRQGRYFVWPIALEGVKERPLLGWGQENFNYIFNEHYRPEMYRLEPWFDRAHNIFLDWAVAGGILGLLSYLLLYVALLFSIWKNINFSHTEKSILTGLIAAYFFHNFFVFDHLISYILFFSLLAYMHSRSEMLSSAHGQASGNSRPTTFRSVPVGIALPAVSILLVLSLYFVNIKPIMANAFLIEALKSLQIPRETLKAVQYFKKAHNASRLGRSEIAEQLAANAVAVLTSDISMEEKNAFFNFAKDALLKQAQDLSEDARYQLITGSFLSATGYLDEALAYLERASQLMPGKQMIYLEIANVFLNKGDKEKTIDVLKYVGEISPDHKEQMEEYIRQIQNG
ncbi:MAG: O-antigen ligase family protein [bacterium]|nr:O-antigen ligase family protein [bacterium]